MNSGELNPNGLTGRFRLDRRKTKVLLAALDLSAQKLAQQLGLQPVTVGRWLSGVQRVHGDRLERIAAALGVSPLYLLDEESLEQADRGDQ